MSRRDRPRVAVLFSPPGPSGLGLAPAARRTVGALRERGFRAWTTTVRLDPARVLRSLSRRRPDVVLPFVSDLRAAARLAALLDWMGLPSAGWPLPTLACALDPVRRQAVLRGSGLNVSPDAAATGREAWRLVLDRPRAISLPVVRDVAGLHPIEGPPCPDEPLSRLAIEAFRALSAADHAVVTLADGAIRDVEFLADLPLRACWTGLLESAGLDPGEVLAEFAQSALNRAGFRPPGSDDSPPS